MRSLSLITIAATFLFTAEARRWRFAVPFPGVVEPSLPEPIHKNVFEDLERKEKLFDTKEVSRRIHKEKVVVEEKNKKDDKLPEGQQPPRIPWIL